MFHGDFDGADIYIMTCCHAKCDVIKTDCNKTVTLVLLIYKPGAQLLPSSYIT
jgi:hypothetical protein